MSFITPVDGQPAIAEHVAQLTQALSGARAEPITLTSTLTLTDATLSRTGPGALRVDASLELAGTGNFLRLADQTTAGRRFDLVAQGDSLYVNRNEGIRLALGATGTLTVAPDSGVAGIAGASGVDLWISTPHMLWLSAAGGAVGPKTDNTTLLGHSTGRWTQVWATSGVVNASSRTVKEGITPLDPARAMEAVRNTEAVTFDYLTPERPAEWYALPDDPAEAEAVLQQRLTAAPREVAARHQAGFIAEDADPLFLVGEGQTSPGNSVGVLLAACQWLAATVDALTERVAALEGTA